MPDPVSLRSCEFPEDLLPGTEPPALDRELIERKDSVPFVVVFQADAVPVR